MQQILDEIVNELGWLARNIQDLSIGDGGAKHEESVQCMECDCRPIRGLAEALRARWSDLMLHQGRFVGLCPDCAGHAERPAAAAVALRRVGGSLARRIESAYRAAVVGAYCP